MKIGPGDMQAFVDVYTAFIRGERTITGRSALAALAVIYDALDKLTVLRVVDGQQVRSPIPEGGELQLSGTQVRIMASVALPVLEGQDGQQRFCDARRTLAALALLERLNAEAENG